MFEGLRNELFSSPEALRLYLTERGRGDEATPETVQRLFDALHDESAGVSLHKNYVLSRMFELSEKLAPVLFSQDWTFAWSGHAKTSFATSDDPFLILDKNRKATTDFSSGPGIATTGSKKILPLRPDVCLIIGSEAPVTHHVRMDRPTIRTLNIEQSRHYERWLVARDQQLVARLTKH